MQNQLPLITYYMDVTSIERTLEASDARRQLSNLQQIVSHINKDSTMNIFSRYVKDISTIVKVIILILLSSSSTYYKVD